MLNFEITKDGWFDGLPKGQIATLESLLAAGNSEEEVAELWLSQFGASTTVGFGAGGVFQHFFTNVKQEFVAFICGDPKYEQERSQAALIWNNQGKVGLVSMVASIVAVNVNLAAAAIVPIIALLFSLVAKIGINAFCGACKIT